MKIEQYFFIFLISAPPTAMFMVRLLTMHEPRKR